MSVIARSPNVGAGARLFPMLRRHGSKQLLQSNRFAPTLRMGSGLALRMGSGAGLRVKVS